MLNQQHSSFYKFFVPVLYVQEQSLQKVCMLMCNFFYLSVMKSGLRKANTFLLLFCIYLHNFD